MIQKHIAGYKGMLKDLSKDKQSDKYFDARNIRILATDKQSSLAMTNEAGNEIIFSIPSPTVNTTDTQIEYVVNSVTKSVTYIVESNDSPRCELEDVYDGITSGTQVIIGVKELRDSAIVASTDGNGFDCFWEVTGINNGSFDLELLYMNNLGLSTANLIQLLFNYENSIIQKVYFVDGYHQLRFMNIRQSTDNGDSLNLIDVHSSSIDTVSTLTISQPEVTSVTGGGSHTTGMIQYAYGLYILNGSQTTISPLSELTPLDKGYGLGGGEINEALGRSVTINIPDIDSKFTHIKIYSIKYTSYNEAPEVLIVNDSEIDDSGSFSFTDTGASGTTITLESFIFLGSDPIVPQHIAAKDNRLFAINVKESLFDVDIDTRAYAHDGGGTAVIRDNPYLYGTSSVAGDYLYVPDNWEVSESHDSITYDYDLYKYQVDGSTLGATGKYIEVELLQTTLTNAEAEGLQFFKDREIYRLGIEFYNRRGQVTDAKWVMDLKAPKGNLEGNYNQLKVSITDEFYTWLADEDNFSSDDEKPVGYKIIRADRQLSDRTILSQGIINPMIANYQDTDKTYTIADVKTKANSNEALKLPSMTRTFESYYPFIECKDYHDLAYEDVNDSTRSDPQASRYTEGFKPASSRDWRAQNWQYNRLMQMFTPEVLFDDIQVDASYKLNVVGLMQQDEFANWATETNPTSEINEVEAKFINGINSSTVGMTPQLINGASAGYLNDRGFFGPTNGDNTRSTNQVYHSFNGAFHPNTGTAEYEIYGSPEVTESGADYKAYNNDYGLRYANNLKTMLMDDWDETDAANDDAAVQIRGCNTNGARCITFAEGPDEDTYPLASRKSIEQIYDRTNISEGDGVLIAEFVRNSTVAYLGGIYGGNSYESKKNSTYLRIGSYTDIYTSSVEIESPGDTFVDTFTFSKMAKDDTDIVSIEYNVVSEIVSTRVETTIDLRNRNDLSVTEWDNRWQPLYSEYQEYNSVYSQQPTLVKSVTVSSKVKKVKEFDGRIVSSKEKIPGEFIDNWTDFLENETMDVNGTYGPINAVANMGDEIFVLQDSAVAHITINPRAQTVGADGVTIELGTGNVLHDYQYISTTSGCLNKYGVVSTPNGFYYVDVLNKSIAACNGKSVQGLSDGQGFHSEFVNVLDYDSLVVDNPVLGSGVSVGFNSVNADVYFTFLQDESFTLSYNEKAGAFVSYYDYMPAWYINKGETMITTEPDSTELWDHFSGNANSFYGTTYPSTITFHVTEPGNEIILNGAAYRQEMTLNGEELALDSLTAVRVYNEYQDSGVVQLEMRKNQFKKFREWTVKFPRDAGTRDRVRSSFGYVEFTLENDDGRELVLHDMTLYYTKY